MMYTGGSANFIEMDDARIALNNEVLTAVSADERTLSGKVEYLTALSGKVFNLGNTVPADLTAAVAEAVSTLVIAVAADLAQEPNRSLAQMLLDLAGPPANAGLANCSGLAGGWLYTDVLSDAARAAVVEIHSRQWVGSGRDK